LPKFLNYFPIAWENKSLDLNISANLKLHPASDMPEETIKILWQYVYIKTNQNVAVLPN
jgi:hypothetical protein